jgi:pyruvate kinase
MNYDVIATLGPSTSTARLWQELLEAGATAFRLNTSHLTLDNLDCWMERIEQFQQDQPVFVPLYLDLQGSKWRLGQFSSFILEPGSSVDLVLAETCSRANCLPVPHRDFFQAAQDSGNEISLNDARVRLELLEVNHAHEWMRARVVLGGEIAPRKGITFLDSSFRLESTSPKDRAICERTRRLGYVRYAVSYVRDGQEMLRYRQDLGEGVHLAAKLERRPALDDALQIARSADSVWLCRGDLGAELGLREMAAAVREFSRSIPALPVPAILAGQVLEHLTELETPTRSEICYLHDALETGYRGVVLSDETAIGRYPQAAVRTAALFR